MSNMTIYRENPKKPVKQKATRMTECNVTGYKVSMKTINGISVCLQ